MVMGMTIEHVGRLDTGRSPQVSRTVVPLACAGRAGPVAIRLAESLARGVAGVLAVRTVAADRRPVRIGPFGPVAPGNRGAW